MADEQDQGVEVAPDAGMLSLINRAEIDTQIATAKRYPRSLKQFLVEAKDLVTLTEGVAEECHYALPRKERDRETGKMVTKMIEGPSARFAEIIAYSWGNCRAGARVVSEDDHFVTAQGAFIDLEKNVAINYEVRRRISGKEGKKFSADMIGVTGNAACSIALRNAVLKGIPKAYWQGLYDAARKTALGDAKTLTSRRSDAFAYFKKFGIDEARICAALGVPGIEDVGLDELGVLTGFKTSIKDGDATIESIFYPEKNTTEKPKSKLEERFGFNQEETGGDAAAVTTCEFCTPENGQHQSACPNNEGGEGA